MASGKLLREFVGKGVPEKIDGVVFSPDGKLAVSSGEGPALRLWDVATGRELRRLTGGE